MFQVPSQITKITTLFDKTIRLTVDCQELSPEDATKLFSLYDKLGWFCFKDTPISEQDLIDIPETTPEFKGKKTPSQRIRATLYVLWEQKYRKDYPEFEIFYKVKAEQIIQFLKNKLN